MGNTRVKSGKSLVKLLLSPGALLYILMSLLSVVKCDDRIPKCSFTQSCIRDASQKGTPCPDPTNTETPIAQVGFPKMPTTSMKYLAEACPYMVDQELCCNDDQILNMYNNFKTIDSLFGNCLICSINLKRFWCEYTCNPYQFYFLESHDQIRVSDVDYPVLNQTMRIDNEVACGIFESCKKNPFVATLASGQSAPGFLEFMGSNAVQTGKVKISFQFSSNPEESMIKDMYACDMEVGDKLEDYDVANCTCNYCEQACKPNDINAFPAFFDGFSILVVGLVYLSLIILSVIIFFIKKKWQSDEDDDDDDFSEDDKLRKYSQSDSSSCQDSVKRLINDSQQHNASYGKINASSDPTDSRVQDSLMK